MLIAHITDSHIEIREPDGVGRLADFEKVVADINRLDPKPDMVIHTGDLTHCNRKIEYQFAKSFLERLHMPYQVIPGNKDDREMMASVFGEKGFGDKVKFYQYRIDVDDWVLFLLDTLSDNSNRGALCDQRLGWLEAQLSDNEKPALIFMHHPSWKLNHPRYPLHFEDQSDADRFNQLIEQFPNVKGVFTGHYHRNEAGQIGKIPTSVLTAMSLDRRMGEDYTPEMEGKPVYQTIELKKDGTFERQLKICL